VPIMRASHPWLPGKPMRQAERPLGGIQCHVFTLANVSPCYDLSLARTILLYLLECAVDHWTLDLAALAFSPIPEGMVGGGRGREFLPTVQLGLVQLIVSSYPKVLTPVCSGDAAMRLVRALQPWLRGGPGLMQAAKEGATTPPERAQPDD